MHCVCAGILKRAYLERYFSREKHILDSVGYRMTEEKTGKHAGKCYDCGGSLELFEIDMKKFTKIMLCRSCGLFHFYKKNFVGNYRLTKVSKNADIGP